MAGSGSGAGQPLLFVTLESNSITPTVILLKAGFDSLTSNMTNNHDNKDTPHFPLNGKKKTRSAGFHCG